jgi:hypothetical protein
MRSLGFSSNCVLAGFIAILSTPLLAGSSHDQGQGTQIEEQAMPNVLVVRSPEIQGQGSKSQAQAPSEGSLQMEQQRAEVIPVRIDIPTTSRGNVDLQQLAQRADQAAVQSDVIPLQTSQELGAMQAPQAVQDEFQRLSQQGELEILPWRWFFRPAGGYYNYYWPNYGYYGWGSSPYYVYNYGPYPSIYRPSFGIYAGGGLYPFTYGHYRRHGGWNYNYYYRHGGGRFGRP